MSCLPLSPEVSELVCVQVFEKVVKIARNYLQHNFRPDGNLILVHHARQKIFPEREGMQITRKKIKIKTLHAFQGRSILFGQKKLFNCDSMKSSMNLLRVMFMFPVTVLRPAGRLRTRYWGCCLGVGPEGRILVQSSSRLGAGGSPSPLFIEKGDPRDHHTQDQCNLLACQVAIFRFVPFSLCRQLATISKATTIGVIKPVR